MTDRLLARRDHVTIYECLVAQPPPDHRHVAVVEYVSGIFHDMKREIDPQQLPGILKQPAFPDLQIAPQISLVVS